MKRPFSVGRSVAVFRAMYKLHRKFRMSTWASVRGAAQVTWAFLTVYEGS